MKTRYSYDCDDPDNSEAHKKLEEMQRKQATEILENASSYCLVVLLFDKVVGNQNKYIPIGCMGLREGSLAGIKQQLLNGVKHIDERLERGEK